MQRRELFIGKVRLYLMSKLGSRTWERQTTRLSTFYFSKHISCSFLVQWSSKQPSHSFLATINLLWLWAAVLCVTRNLPAGSGVMAAIDNYTRTTESCGGIGMAWPLSQEESALNLAWTSFYCFSGHITLRMVLIYYAQFALGGYRKERRGCC